MRPARQGSIGWRFETSKRRHGEDCRSGRARSSGVLDVDVRYCARIGRQRRHSVVRQHSCRSCRRRRCDRAWSWSTRTASSTSCSRRRVGCSSTRPVYDLDVERTHNFVAERDRHPQLDLQVPRGGLPQLVAVRGGVSRRDDRGARPELPVDAAHSRRRQRGDREQRAHAAEASLDRQGRGRADRPVPRRRRARRSRVRRPRDPPSRRRRRLSLRRHRGLLPHQRAEPRARRSHSCVRACRTACSAA